MVWGEWGMEACAALQVRDIVNIKTLNIRALNIRALKHWNINNIKILER